jgi:hypothetical protein
MSDRVLYCVCPAAIFEIALLRAIYEFSTSLEISYTINSDRHIVSAYTPRILTQKTYRENQVYLGPTILGLTRTVSSAQGYTPGMRKQAHTSYNVLSFARFLPDNVGESLPRLHERVTKTQKEQIKEELVPNRSTPYKKL